MFNKIGDLKILVKFTGKHSCWSLFSMKFKTSRPATLLKTTPAKKFSCEFCETFKTSFLQNTYGRLFLMSTLQIPQVASSSYNASNSQFTYLCFHFCNFFSTRAHLSFDWWFFIQLISSTRGLLFFKI